jgi:PIN domain nuclease of toxin-antitoxin system
MGTLTVFGDYGGYLLDTHSFLWAIKEPHRLGSAARAVIEDPDTRLYLSSASAYELTYKSYLGKLPDYSFVVDNYVGFAHELGVIDLPITLGHAYQAGSMSWEHRDPFDRILAAQAALENLAFITNDSVFASLGWHDLVW